MCWTLKAWLGKSKMLISTTEPKYKPEVVNIFFQKFDNDSCFLSQNGHVEGDVIKVVLLTHAPTTFPVGHWVVDLVEMEQPCQSHHVKCDAWLQIVCLSSSLQLSIFYLKIINHFLS